MNKHDRMYQQIEKHGEDLKRIFNLDIDAIKLCKKLHSLEAKAHHAATCLCNTNTLDRMELTRQEERTGIKQATEEEQDAFFEAILTKVDKILNFSTQGIPVFINHDPRGYALKIKSEYCQRLQVYQDWGGYGILAPEFDGKE
jgi:elongation factor P--beta-lysine ligase